MNDYIDEKWIYIDRVYGRGTMLPTNIVAISNTGKAKRLNGEIIIIPLRQRVSVAGEKIRCYKLIADNFLITVKRPDQNLIDHVTHNPSEYAVNDVRNLRYCNQKENMNFDEAVKNRHYGPDSPGWKGGGRSWLLRQRKRNCL